MVCTTCEKKLQAVACPEKWKEGSNSRKINENKAIGKTKKYAPYATGKAAKCKVCKSTLHQEGIYCHGCAYKKGLCAMCGKQILDTKNYKQSAKSNALGVQQSDSHWSAAAAVAAVAAAAAAAVEAAAALPW